MFNRLKNWVFNHSAPDHAVASFAWFGFSALTAGTAVLFPAFAPIALGTAAVASKIGVVEGILTGAHLVGGALSWLFGKIFKPKAQPSAPKTPAPSNTKSEKSKEESNQKQNTQEKAKTETSEKAEKAQPEKQAPLKPMPLPELFANQEKPVQAPLEQMPQMFAQQQRQPRMQQMQMPAQPVTMPRNFQQPQAAQVPAEQLMALIQQIKALEIEVRRMRQEILVLRARNRYLTQYLAQRNRSMNRRRGHRHSRAAFARAQFQSFYAQNNRFYA